MYDDTPEIRELEDAVKDFEQPIQYGPPPLKPGYRWETVAEGSARFDENHGIERAS